MLNRTLATLAVLSALCGFAPLAEAAKISCELEDRTGGFFRDTLPKEILGRVRCSPESLPKNQKNSSFYVGKLPSAEREQLIAWFKSYEKSEVPESQRTLLLEKEGASATDTWLEFESDLGPAKRFSHYMFTAPATDGGVLVFIYTDAAPRARQHRNTIRNLMRTFRDQEYRDAISGAL